MIAELRSAEPKLKARAGKKRSPVPNLFWCGGKRLESERPPEIFVHPRFPPPQFFLPRSQLCCTSGRANEVGAPPKL